MPTTFDPPKRPSTRGFRIKEASARQRVMLEGGYSQRAAVGPHPTAVSGKITFANLTVAEKEEIVSFLRDRRGVEAFFFQLPSEMQPRLWTCAEWDIAPEKNKVDWRVSMTLTEEFDLS
ncbi:phage tail protein [Thalassovita sp.]|uniref:phage tail protein n=1 Tax=Thalassovita sp. TaxID=1979401 RepID=UPI002AB00465|nr:phage tail protein [Thalassovita sp.]